MVQCCSVLQCAAVCCSVLHSMALYCRVLPCIAVCCSVLQCVAVCCRVWYCIAVYCRVLQCVAVWCSVVNVLHKRLRITTPNTVAVSCRVLQSSECDGYVLQSCALTECDGHERSMRQMWRSDSMRWIWSSDSYPAVSCRLLHSLAVSCSVLPSLALSCRLLQCVQYFAYVNAIIE